MAEGQGVFEWEQVVTVAMDVIEDELTWMKRHCQAIETSVKKHMIVLASRLDEGDQDKGHKSQALHPIVK